MTMVGPAGSAVKAHAKLSIRMSFTIRLSQDQIAAEAGSNVPVTIEIVNKADAPDKFEIQVEGIDPEWVATPEPVFTVGAGETKDQKVFVKAPRASESIASNYPFVVRVRSLQSGEARTVQGVFQIKAYHHLSMEISPKKGFVSPARHNNVFAVTIMNLGNTEHTLQLSGADPEEECTFEFSQSEISIGPGQQKTVEVVVTASKPSLIASSQLFGFTISARSIQSPNVTANTQAQLEQRPALSLASLALIIFLFALAVLWFAFRPKPPTLRLSSEQASVVSGETTTIRWSATNANSVRLEIKRKPDSDSAKESDEVLEDQPLSGTKQLVATDAGTITVTATAVGDTKTFSPPPLTISVQAPPVVNPPKILSFSASSRRVKLGDPVVLNFKFSSDVDHAVLAPTNDQIVPAMDQLEVHPSRVGDLTYELIAFNKQGGQTSKKVTVNVYQASQATILDFSANPVTIEAPNDLTLVTWRVTNAAVVQLDDGQGNLRTVDPVNQDGLEVRTGKNIQMKLIATDAQGVTASKTLLIKYKPLPPPSDTEPPSTTSGTEGTPVGAGGVPR